MVLVYVPMCADLLHHGHINILNEARRLADETDGDTRTKGIVIAGLVSDDRMRDYKGEPFLQYKHREAIVNSLIQVDIVSKVDTQPLFIDDILNLQPKYVVHGSDWAQVSSPLFMVRQKIIEIIGDWQGHLYEVPYTEGVSSSWIKQQIMAREYAQEKVLYGDLLE